MYATSSRFLQEPKRSHTALTYCEVWEAGARVRGRAGQPLTIYPVAGSITVEATAPIRRSINVDFGPRAEDATDLIPDDNGNGPIGPYGTELRVYRGFVYPTVNAETGSATEVVPIGAFRLTKPVIGERDGAMTIRCRGFDFAWLLQTPLRVPHIIPAGTEVGAAFRSLVNAKAPFLRVEATETRFTVPSDVVVGRDNDPWEIARELAASAGCNAYADVEGRIVMAPTSLKVSRQYVWDFNADAPPEDPSVPVIDLERSYDNDRSPNVWTVIGNNGGAAGDVEATAVDDDPHSPTFVGGKYGEVTEQVRTELVRTNDQADEMAHALLANSIGAHEQLRLSSVPIPNLAEWDPVRVTRAALGVNGRIAVIDTMSIPLTAEETMGLSLRRMPLTDIGLPTE